jgi:hypothetical protein
MIYKKIQYLLKILKHQDPLQFFACRGTKVVPIDAQTNSK